MDPTDGSTYHPIGSILTSSNYPNNYGHNSDCATYVGPTATELLVLYFESFAVEYTKECTADYLRAAPSHAATSSLKLCGFSKLPPMVMTAPIFLMFHSDPKFAFNGFKIKVDAGNGNLDIIIIFGSF